MSGDRPSTVTRPLLTTRPLEVTGTGHYEEVLYDDGTNAEGCVCAAHGGRIEPGTAELALELATRLPATTCWACLGYDESGEEFELWHPPSSAMAPADYPLLERIADRGFATVVSLHGQAGDDVLVGGGIDDAAKRDVADRLEAELPVSVEPVSEGPYAGTSEANFVNWLASDGAGLQLELSQSVRASASASGAVLDVLADWIADQTCE